MQSVKENQKINKQLAQIQAALKNEAMITMINKNEREWIFKIINSINCQVVATNFLQLEYPEWIGNTALHFAADERILETFDILLNHGADFTIKNNNNSTALHEIIETVITRVSTEHNLQNPFAHSVLSAHIKYNNFENPINQNGLSHFHVACAVNYVEAVKGFLQSGVVIDHAVNLDSLALPGYTSLHFATKYCASETVDLLITHGSNVHIKDAKGLTPLHVALERKLEIVSDIDSDKTMIDKNDKILQLLLNKESNGNVVIIDDWGLSNFHVSCAMNNSKVAEHILSKAVEIDHTVNIDSPLWAGYTALHFTALCNVDVVTLLIEKGADINLKNAKGVTPFDMCIERYENKDISKIISLHTIWRNIMLSDGKTKLSDLVFAMRDLNQLDIFLNTLSKNIRICRDSPLWPGCSPIHLAVIFAKKDDKVNEEYEEINLQILRDQYEQNPSMLHSQDVHGRTPLHLAFHLNKKPVVNILIEFLKGCSYLVDHVDKDGLSYVHITSAQNDIHTLGRLLSRGTYVNIVYRGKSRFSPMVYSGSTPLHFAVVNKSTEAADILVKQGADVYAKDANDMTPIHLLLLSEATTNMCNILLSRPNLQNSTVSGIGLSHLHVASWFSFEAMSDVVKRLLDNGADANAKITFQKNAKVESDIFTILEEYEGHSPLIMAYNNENFVVFRLLLEYGVDIFIEYTEGKALLVYHILNRYDYVANYLRRSMSRSEALMARLKVDAGMTSLHLACFDLNADLIKKSLNEGANVNAQIQPDSPVFQGDTPLHIFMYFCKYSQDDVNEVIELLLKAGANVTLQNATLRTAIHVAYNTFLMDQDKESHSHMNMLLEAQQDFSINPANLEGINHFHIACYICNDSIVEKFLDCGKVDINEWTDYFSDGTAGCSALHLISQGNVPDVSGKPRRLETIDLLLSHGADVHTEDYNKDTPLHECVLYDSFDLFERVSRSGADVNARNVSGRTPLYHYLKAEEATIEGIKTLLRFGCRLNTYCPITHKGYLGETINVFSYPNVSNLICALTINFKLELQLDDLGRTAIHNLVSIKPPKISAKEYVELIEQLYRTGSDVDDQDTLGRTALHLAVNFYNFKAISGLLLAGADVNIRDNNGNTALGCKFDKYKQCYNKHDEDKMPCKHLKTLQVLAAHVKKLQLCGLDVHKQNDYFTSKAFEKLLNGNVLTDEFFEELETAKSTKIESHALTLFDFLSEYGAVVDYPRMSRMKRNDVAEFFSPSKIQKVRERFPNLAGILQLQYRKVKVRSELVELAKYALTVYIGFVLPEICSELIVILLKNSDLKNLIASISSVENDN